MKLAVFGATGHVGQQLVAQATTAGHHVSALARRPAALAAQTGLTVVEGDVREPQAVARAIEGCDAVISTLGQRSFLKKVTVCSDAMQIICPMMSSDGVRRLVAVSGYGLAETRRSVYGTIAWMAIRSIMKDKEAMETLIRSSGADWTLARPALLVNGPGTGRYQAAADLHLGLRSRISYADLATFLLHEACDGDFVGQAVAVTSATQSTHREP